MYKTIWKFEIPIQDQFQIQMPEGAEILDVQMQFGHPVLWALVIAGNPPEYRTFQIKGTGHIITDLSKKDYISTFQQYDGQLIWHLFEIC